jgi:branched-chain amino acid aminotransferase
VEELFWHDGDWREKEERLLTPKDNSFWMGNAVFDGGRSVKGLIPDLDRHCNRAVESASRMLMRPKLNGRELTDICKDGLRRFSSDSTLYVRPMFFARGGFLVPDPDTTECAIAILRVPLPFENGLKAAISPFKRPAPDMAPNDAKSGCHYPNMQRAIVWAQQRGADTAIVLNPDGSIGEFAAANIFIVKDDRVYTPAANGSILPGITRARVIDLLRKNGVETIETQFSAADVYQADEVFSTGNHVKVAPVVQIDQRTYEIGPISKKAKALYWDYAEQHTL